MEDTNQEVLENEPTTAPALTEEERAALEPEIDFGNPDATPARYNIFAAEKNKQATEMAVRFLEEIVATDLPFAFAEIIPQILAGKMKIHKAKCKAFEAANRASNKAHLTPINSMELYENLEELKAPLVDVDSEEDI